MRVAQFGVGYEGIVGSDAEAHGLAGKVPLSVGIEARGRGAEGEQQREGQGYNLGVHLKACSVLITDIVFP